MSLKLKEGINPKILINHGFKTGKEWSEQGERCLKGEGYKYQHEWYHKFLMDEENPEKIMYANEEYDQPSVHISIRVGDNFNNDIYIDCTPSDTYHIGGSELDIISETLFDLTNNGLLEKQIDS